ncbi:MAG: type II toxin-antitoxin system RelE/ParE family toxin [Patescibacteria group bacterium]
MYKVFITNKAEKQLDRLDKADARDISKKILELDFPFASNFDIQKMVDPQKMYRLRVGKARIIMKISDAEKRIYIVKIGYRGAVYG